MKTGADFIFAVSGAVELVTRKAGGIVRGEGWCGNPSGSRPNFFGDSTSPLTRGGKNVVRSEGEASNPSVLTAERFGDKKGGCAAI